MGSSIMQCCRYGWITSIFLFVHILFSMTECLSQFSCISIDLYLQNSVQSLTTKYFYSCQHSTQREREIFQMTKIFFFLCQWMFLFHHFIIFIFLEVVNLVVTTWMECTKTNLWKSKKKKNEKKRQQWHNTTRCKVVG